MNSNWSNTALVAYSLLPKIVRELDFGVNTRVNLCYRSRHLKQGISTERLISEILELTDEKRKIVNLAYLVESTLEHMRPRDKEILTDRMINKKTFQAIAEELDIALRTVFRRLDAALLRFSSDLSARGYTESWFEKEYGKDKYISRIKARLSDEKYLIAKSI